MDIFLNWLIRFYSNNTINLRLLSQRIISCYSHKMAIVSWPQILWRHFTLRIAAWASATAEQQQQDITNHHIDLHHHHQNVYFLPVNKKQEMSLKTTTRHWFISLVFGTTMVSWWPERYYNNNNDRLRPLIRDNPGRPVPEETFTHSHPSRSSCFRYHLSPFATVHKRKNDGMAVTLTKS